LFLSSVAAVTACASGGVHKVLARQNVPYAVVDGHATTLGGQAGVIGYVHGPVPLEVGHRLTVMPVRIAWPRSFSSDPTVLKEVGDHGLGVFEGERPGMASLLMDTSACARSSGPDCVLVDVLVTINPPPPTATMPTVSPTTSPRTVTPSVTRP
jgi:hypothetical protein